MSRSLNDLHPDAFQLVENFLARVDNLGIDLLVTCTFRSDAEQELLYAQGRTAPGKIVTWARAGESKHNSMLNGRPASRAIDVVPLRHGKCVWGTSGNGLDDDPTDDERDDLELWLRVAACGKLAGLQWAGEWPKNKREFPHFQA